MRDRESVEIERKNAIRNLEKQAKVVERLADSEKNLQQQIVRSFSLHLASTSSLTIVILTQGHLEAANQRLHRVMDEAETKFNALEADVLMYKKQAECTEEMMKNVRFFIVVWTISITSLPRFERLRTKNMPTSTTSRVVYSRETMTLLV